MQPGQIGPRHFRRIALVGVSIVVAACQSTGALDGAGASSSNPASESAKLQPAALILSGDPAAFIGLGDDELARALGEPRQVRKDAPAEIWQYSGADCVVDFYLYEGDGGLEVAYLEARNPAADATPTDRCVKSLLQSVSVDGQQKTL